MTWLGRAAIICRLVSMSGERSWRSTQPRSQAGVGARPGMGQVTRDTCHVSSSAPVLCQKLVTGSPDRGPRYTWYSWPGDTWHAAASSHTEAGLIFDVEAGWRDEARSDWTDVECLESQLNIGNCGS